MLHRCLKSVLILLLASAFVGDANARHVYRISLEGRSLREAAADGADARHFRKAGVREAVEPLAAAADALAAWHAALPEDERSATDFRFPRSTPWTPRRLPCPASKPAVSPDDPAWSHSTWKAIGFRPKAPQRHQFRFVSTGRGREAMFALVARGDADCNRKRAVFRLSGHARRGKLVINVVRLRNPHE